MSLKAEIETQAAALKAYDEQDFEKALQIYETIADTSKIHTNIGLILATLGEHEAAVDSFNAATELDQYLAIAYFQCGVSNFLLGRFEYALKDFEEALLYLRGNQNINYEQLGLKFKLHAAEVYFNKGLCLLNLGDEQAGMADLQTAQQSKVMPEHDVIDDAIRDKGEEYTVFSIPVGILFRPSETKLRNAKAKDYLGKAKLISAADARDEFTAFTGVTRLRAGMTPSGAKLDAGMVAPGGGGGGNNGPTLPPPPSSELTGAGAKGLSRAATAAARSSSSTGGGSISRSATIGGSLPSGPTRGLSLRYRNGSNDDGNSNEAPAPPVPAAAAPSGATGVSRSATQINVRDRNQPPPPPASNGRSASAPQIPAFESNSNSPRRPSAPAARLTEIYDDYLDDLGGDEEQPPVPNNPSARVEAWAQNTKPGSPAPPSAMPSPPGGATGNDRLRKNLGAGGNGNGNGNGVNRGGGSVRRGTGTMTRRGTTRNRDGSTVYEEEEEGYVSGEYEDVVYGMSKLRVKIHFEDDIRGMTLSPSITFEEFADKVAAKFGRTPPSLVMKFVDDEGHKVTLIDESDYDLATEVARDTARGKSEGKLEIWCTARK